MSEPVRKWAARYDSSRGVVKVSSGLFSERKKTFAVVKSCGGMRNILKYRSVIHKGPVNPLRDTKVEALEFVLQEFDTAIFHSAEELFGLEDGRNVVKKAIAESKENSGENDDDAV